MLCTPIYINNMNYLLRWSNKMSEEAQKEISKHVKKHMDAGMTADKAEAAAYSEAREKGFDVPEKK